MVKIICVFLSVLVLTVLIMMINEKQNARVCFNSNCFNARLAITNEERKKGLMHIDAIKDNEGMLFINEKEDIYPFWMKNVKFPLDIIWINEDKKVVFISENSKPCFDDNCPHIDPGVKAKYILEINAGLSKKIGLGIGSSLDIII